MHQVLGDVRFEYILHEELKELSKAAKIIIRTGVITPYTNVILQRFILLGRGEFCAYYDETIKLLVKIKYDGRPF